MVFEKRATHIRIFAYSISSLCLWLGITLGVLSSAPTKKISSPYVIYVNRSLKKFWVIDSDHHILLSTGVGTGRGGLKKKINMDDLVTPTGTFSVDIILFKDKRFNRVSESNLTRYRNTKFYNLLASPGSLSQLFLNMNSLDFDGNGKADRAYGDGYIGITSTDKKQITGPKMQYFGAIPFWCSIGLHGTNNPQNIGEAKSGGCIHLPANIISQLIVDHLVDIGSTVVINDKEPFGNTQIELTKNRRPPRLSETLN